VNESILFLAAFVLYIISALGYFSFLFSKKENLARIGFSFALAGLIIHTTALVWRTFESGHAPFTNMYESLSFLAWSSILAYLIVESKFKIRRAGAYFLLIVIALMALASSPLMPKDATPLVPALQSYWLWLHVSVTLLGEAFFALAFITSIMYLVTDSKERKGMKTSLSAEKFDSVSYRSVAVGFPLFTLGGIVFGMVWAYYAWGRFWGWDPKETWSLITWFFFALYLHTRIVMGWKGRRSAYVAIIGFLAAIFTYFGVNYLLVGLHGYA
jgi:cytochrome c-type biogenesis protein CcsB